MAYTLIATQTLTTATASVTFSSIPNTYKDLVLECFTRSTGASDALCIQFNGDTGSNYSFTQLYGTGSSALSNRGSNQTFIATTPELSSSAAGTYAPDYFQIMSYSNTSVNKTVLVRRNSTSSGLVVGSQACLWRSNSAISSILVFSQSAQLASGTAIKLWAVS